MQMWHVAFGDAIQNKCYICNGKQSEHESENNSNIIFNVFVKVTTKPHKFIVINV